MTVQTLTLNKVPRRSSSCPGRDTQPIGGRMHPQRTVARRDLVLIPCGSRRRRLPIRTLVWLEDAPCVDGQIIGKELHELSDRTVPVTTAGYHLGRPSPRKGKKYSPTPPSGAEVMAILAQFPMTHLVGRRNHAHTVFLWRTGLRVAESLDLTPEDFDLPNFTVTVQCGKGGKRRLTAMDDMSVEAVGEWLDELDWLGHKPYQPVFCVLHKLRFNRACCNTYRDALKDATRKAGVTKRVVPHQLRHAMAVDMDREGVRLPIISRQLGHSNLATTSIYLSGISASEIVDVVMARPDPRARG